MSARQAERKASSRHEVVRHLRALGVEVGRVGHAHARLFRARDVVRVVLEHLAEDPLLFLHPPGAGCAACDKARQSVVA